MPVDFAAFASKMSGVMQRVSKRKSYLRLLRLAWSTNIAF
jgi:hypothetical protein